MALVNSNLEIQKLLKDSGLYSGELDGDMGKGTIAAIDTMLSLKGINTDKWSKARKLLAAEQTLYQSQDIEVGAVDGLEGPMLQHAREVYNAKLVTTWRDRNEEIEDAKAKEKQGPAGYFNKIFSALYRMGQKKNLKNPEIIAFLGAAQNCLETGYGKSMVGNNAWGIKGKGPAGSIDAWTRETINGETKRMVQTFRAYHNLDEAANDYLDLLTNNPRYKAIFDATTVEEAIEIQGKTGYATSPVYGRDLLSIYKKYGWMARDTLEAWKTEAEVAEPPSEPPSEPTTTVSAPTKKYVWPRESEVPSFYGNVGTHQTMCEMPFPLRIAWDLKSKLKAYNCHEKVKENMERVWQRTFDYYGYEKIKELGIDLFGGCLNVRRKRGGSNWSMHAWGIACDIDPDRNSLHTSWKNSQMSKPAYKQFVQFWYDEGAINLGKEANYDPMHYQFARLNRG